MLIISAGIDREDCFPALPKGRPFIGKAVPYDDPLFARLTDKHAFFTWPGMQEDIHLFVTEDFSTEVPPVTRDRYLRDLLLEEEFWLIAHRDSMLPDVEGRCSACRA